MVAFVEATVCLRLVSVMVSMNFSSLFALGRFAIGNLFLTKGNWDILFSAAWSEVLMSTWFSHFELLRISTFPALAMLSRYTFDTGRSVLSMAILNCFLLASFNVFFCHI